MKQANTFVSGRLLLCNLTAWQLDIQFEILMCLFMLSFISIVDFWTTLNIKCITIEVRSIPLFKTPLTNYLGLSSHCTQRDKKWSTSAKCCNCLLSLQTGWSWCYETSYGNQQQDFEHGKGIKNQLKQFLGINLKYIWYSVKK